MADLVCLTFAPGKVPGLLCHPEGALRDALATELNSPHFTAGPLSEGQSLRKDEKSLDIPQGRGSQSQFPFMAAQTDEDASTLPCTGQGSLPPLRPPWPRGWRCGEEGRERGEAVENDYPHFFMKCWAMLMLEQVFYIHVIFQT